MKTLVDHGYSVLATSNSKSTPLLLAAQYGHVDVVKELLKFGASSSINTPKSRGKTPLYLAVDGGHKEVVEELLKNGANIEESFRLRAAYMLSKVIHFNCWK